MFSALTRIMTRGVGRLPIVATTIAEAMIGIITRTTIAEEIKKTKGERSVRI